MYVGALPPALSPETVARVLGPPHHAGRRTRIVATVGPSSADVETLTEMIRAGMDVARLNFSHVRTLDQASVLVDNLRQAMKRAGRQIEILGDLQGPKLRLGELAAPIELREGQPVRLAESGESGAERLVVAPPGVVRELEVGERVLINDGRVVLKVTALKDGEALAEVVQGGQVSSRKGVNLPDSRLTQAVPTEHDRASIDILRKLGVDLVAVSFVESGADLERVREAFGPGHPVRLIAKMERPRALSNFDDVAQAADGMMVARGDLAVEMDTAAVPVAQQYIHTRGAQLGLVTGTATQMLDSMRESATPTRAEAADVASSVWQGAEFVMTSDETAVGKDPVGVIQTMDSLVREAERYGAQAARGTLDWDAYLRTHR